MGNSYNTDDHGVLLNIIDYRFNDMWVYTQFTDHKSTYANGTINMQDIVSVAYAKYNILKDVESTVFAYKHTLSKKDDVPVRSSSAPVAILSPVAPSAPLNKYHPSANAAEPKNTDEPTDTAEHRIETWWFSRCDDDRTYTECTPCQKITQDSKLADMHTYKNIYKRDRAEYNTTLSHGLHATSPIAWSPRNPNHYAYIMGKFYKTLETIPPTHQPTILKYFKLDTTPAGESVSSITRHLKKSIDYANTLFFGIPENNWYDQWWIKTGERILTLILIIQAIFAIIIVYVDVKKLTNNITEITGDISIFSKRGLYINTSSEQLPGNTNTTTNVVAAGGINY
jgi:hypothetical protein